MALTPRRWLSRSQRWNRRKPLRVRQSKRKNDYEFAPIENSGKVNIENFAYGKDEANDHIYTVSIQDGTAVDCSCPGHEHNVTTKHRDAVENHQNVIDVADPDRCSNGHEFCPGPAAIDPENGPEVGDQFGCLDCWNDACVSEGRVMTYYCEDCAPAYAHAINRDVTCDFCNGAAAYTTEDGSDTLGLSASCSIALL